jgi:hypothetical protein
MSSPRAAAAKAVHKPRSPLKPARKVAVKTAAKGVASASAGADASAQAIGLAASIEASLADGDIQALTPAALQALLGAACKAYAAQVEAGQPLAALPQRTTVSPTEVMVTASGLLRAANLAVFELGMWQSWTGR